MNLRNAVFWAVWIALTVVCALLADAIERMPT